LVRAARAGDWPVGPPVSASGRADAWTGGYWAEEVRNGPSTVFFFFFWSFNLNFSIKSLDLILNNQTFGII
jgi:hypothetical protein